MTNEEYEKQKQRYEELAAKYYSNVQMSPEEVVEFVNLRDIYEPVEQEDGL